MAYWGAFYPADTVKSEIQTMTTLPADRGRSLVLYTFRRIYRAQGIAGLYAGVIPSMLRAAPAHSALFLCYEFVSNALRPL